MKVTLHNFKCHTDGEFEFFDTGLVLLSGSTGSGKSSILKAILYAFFGTKAVRKPYTYGTQKCKVILEFNGIKITRTNRPNRLIVGKYEDDVAQAFIEEKLGFGYDEFMISSYIPQKNTNSILSIAQTEQLRMIKILSFEKMNNAAYRDKINDMIHESSDELIERRANAKFIQEEFSKISSRCEKIEFPLPKSETIKSFKKRVATFSQRHSELLEKYTELRDKIRTYIHITAELDTANEQITIFEEKIQNFKLMETQLKEALVHIPVDLKAQIARKKAQLAYHKLQKEYSVLQIQFDQLYVDKMQDRETRKKIIEDALWIYTDGTCKKEDIVQMELKQCRKKMDLWKQHKQAKKQFIKVLGDSDQSYTEAVDYFKMLLTHTQDTLTNARSRVKCPECDTDLCWTAGKLIKSPLVDHNTTDIKELVEKEANYSSTLQCLYSINFPQLKGSEPTLEAYKSLKLYITELQSFIIQNTQREIDLERISREDLSPMLMDMQKEIQLKQAFINKQRTNNQTTDDNKTIRSELETLDCQLANYNKNARDLKEATTKLNDAQKRYNSFISTIRDYDEQLSRIDFTACNDEMTSINDKISKLKEQNVVDKELEPKVERYVVYRKHMDEITRWENQLADITKKVNNMEKRHSASLVLKDRYIQAEIMALESTINSINQHTLDYLETFFPETQLTANLQVLSGKNANTLKISTYVYYKGNEYDNIHELSGGEFDRCTLASICGVNSMLGSPILILDESLSSLDTIINTDIFRFLSQLAQEKLILVCSHEAVQGIFDQIIEI